MTALPEEDGAEPDEGVVERRVVDVDGVPMSARVREVPDPVAVVVALHGGGTDSRYFDHPGLPRLSLVRVGAALGFTVVALDRPGYGASAGLVDATTPVARRAALAYGALDRLLGPRSRGAGLFAVAHSAGCELAVRMALHERSGEMIGIELAGTGRRHHAVVRETLNTRTRDAAWLRTRRRMRDLLWNTPDLYPEDVVGGARIASESPDYEAPIGRRWPQDFAELAAGVYVPVHISLGDHEQVWSSGPDALADLAGLFTAAPRVVAEEQAESGHNLSIGLTAPAYHLRVLSFVEECVVARTRTSRADQRTGRVG